MQTTDQYWKLFVEVWQSCDSVQDVATRMNKSKNAVTKDAQKLRKLGVNLKRMLGHDNTAREAPDVAALNELINKLEPKKAS